MLRMIDQADYQKTYWTAAALRINGIQVVAIKVTEGIGYENPYYGWQLSQARLAGCAVMHYHLAHPESHGAHEEAGYFFSKVKAAPGDLIMLDAEAQIFTSIPATAASAWTAQWCELAHARFGCPAVIYTSGAPIGNGALESVRGKNPLFYAYPGANPDHPPAPPMPWLVSFLQYGVNTRWAPPDGTDMDVAYFDGFRHLAELAIPPRKFELTATASGHAGRVTKSATFDVTWA